MLTEHRPDNEGNKLPVNRGDKSEELYEFIRSCRSKSLGHWEEWLARYVKSYTTVEPVDDTFFADDARSKYWCACRIMISKRNALIFVDPDTGLETGNPSYLRRMGRAKYILNHELQLLVENIDHSSALMIYQHLPNNKHMHVAAVQRKLAQVRDLAPSVHACAYREDDLAFLFVSKWRKLHEEIRHCLRRYHSRSKHKYRSFHVGKPPAVQVS